MKKISLSLSLIVFSFYLSLAQTPGIQWQQTLGTKGYNGFNRVIKTNDGGVLMVGFKAMDSLINWDAWVVKKDATGITQWDKTFGGSGDDEAYNIIQTSDGSFLIAGSNSSPETPGHHGTDTSGYGSYNDAWIFKLSANGTIIWQKLIGGKSQDYAEGICEDANGNYFISGTTGSNDGDFLNKKRDSLGRNDGYIAKLSTSGNLLNAKCFGGSNSDELYAILCNSASIVAVGSTNSYDLDVNGLHISPDDTLAGVFRGDMWYVRLDTNLNLITQKCFGGTKYESASNIKLLPNGNYIIVGTAGSQDGDVTGHYPSGNNTGEAEFDGWMVEVNNSGTIISQKTIGGNYWDEFFDCVTETDGSVVISGLVASPSLFPQFGTDGNGWIIKLDAARNIVWQHSSGGSGFEWFYGICSSGDGGYYVVGETDSEDGDVTTLIGESNGWMVKFGNANYIVGKSYVDANNNNEYDAGEKFYKGLKIQSGKKGVVLTGAFSDLNGEFKISLDTGDYNTQAIPVNPYYSIVPSAVFTTHATYFNTDSVDFALQPVANKNDLVVSLWPNTVARPGFDMSYRLIYFNRGTTTISNGKVKFRKDNHLNFISSTPASTTIIGDTLVWDFNNFKPFDTAVINISLRVAAPPAVNIGDTMRSVALVEPVSGDETAGDNSAVLIQNVQGSYDPNDKTELHGGKLTPQQLAGNEYLTYLIRFQNTGTDTAFNIFVRDTLDTKLDWNSFEMLDASHNYNLTIKERNKLEWFFTNIRLPDSNINEQASHGYIVYRIKPQSVLAEGDSVQNRASIYFDYNLPVNTNNDKTFIRSNIVTSVIDLNSRETQLYLYPNPANGWVMVTKEGKLKGVATLQVMDINGRLLRQVNYGNVNTNSFKMPVDLKKLPRGSYVLQLRVGKAVYTGKIIVQ